MFSVPMIISKYLTVINNDWRHLILHSVLLVSQDSKSQQCILVSFSKICQTQTLPYDLPQGTPAAGTMVTMPTCHSEGSDSITQQHCAVSRGQQIWSALGRKWSFICFFQIKTNAWYRNKITLYHTDYKVFFPL